GLPRSALGLARRSGHLAPRRTLRPAGAGDLPAPLRPGPARLIPLLPRSRQSTGAAAQLSLIDFRAGVYSQCQGSYMLDFAQSGFSQPYSSPCSTSQSQAPDLLATPPPRSRAMPQPCSEVPGLAARPGLRPATES